MFLQNFKNKFRSLKSIAFKSYSCMTVIDYILEVNNISLERGNYHTCVLKQACNTCPPPVVAHYTKVYTLYDTTSQDGDLNVL